MDKQVDRNDSTAPFKSTSTNNIIHHQNYYELKVEFNFGLAHGYMSRKMTFNICLEIEQGKAFM